MCPPDDVRRHAGAEPAWLTVGRIVPFDPAGARHRRPRWWLFDDLWYRARYAAPDSRSFYQQIGCPRLLHSPSRLFDEQWYCARYAEVRADLMAGIHASGFEHYCAGGYQDHSPNCLFDEAYYRQANAALFREGGAIEAGGYANGYDHYLSEGADLGRQPSRYFDEAVWRAFRIVGGTRDESGRTPLEQCLADAETAGHPHRFTRTSWYFDPDWYVARYSEVADAIAAGQWTSPLAHYLGNWWPARFDPHAHFSEAQYGQAYPDVKAALEAGAHRTGYVHFLEHGAAEGRNPAADIDLARFTDAAVRLEIEGGLYPDAFASYIASRLDDSVRATSRTPAPTEAQARLLFVRTSRTVASVSLHPPLDFTPAAGAVVSVIMVLHNRFDFTISALLSLRAQLVDIELILVDSGSSDETAHIERHVRGAHVLRLPGNPGFVAGCNAGLAAATAEAILYVNNDVVLAPRALRTALDRLASRPDAGAVGGRIVRLHGALQEAGCILWQDGSTAGYLRDQAPDRPEANFVREVDFCSAAFLLVRASAVRALAGFDSIFAPAYYEDADLCVRLRKAGYVTLYDPAILLHHYEYGSSDAGWAVARMAQARQTFRVRHAELLDLQFRGPGTDMVRARSSRRGQRRVLMIEDRIPQRRFGSGYVRSNDIVRCMAALDYAVTVFPMHLSAERPLCVRDDFPDTVELMHDRSASSLAAFLAERADFYDLIWIGRTHNLRALLPLFDAAPGEITTAAMILDTEAVVAPRMIAKRELDGDDGTDDGLPSLRDALEQELSCARLCQRVIAVNEQDADHIRLCGYSAVDVLGHMVRSNPTPNDFAQRRGLLFVGAMHAQDAPNFDSLVWFTRDVLPLVTALLGSEARLTIAGHVAPGVDVQVFAGDPRVALIGEVDDLTPLYDSHRVFVAPTRYAGGIPFKVHEAAAFGLPVVATSILCRQLGWTDGVELLDGGEHDPLLFARQVVGLYEEADLWRQIRATSLARIAQDNAEDQFQARLGGILAAILADTRERDDLA